jgi:hypothetical protein
MIFSAHEKFVIPDLIRDPASSSCVDKTSGIPGQARDDEVFTATVCAA